MINTKKRSKHIFKLLLTAAVVGTASLAMSLSAFAAEKSVLYDTFYSNTASKAELELSPGNYSANWDKGYEFGMDKEEDGEYSIKLDLHSGTPNIAYMQLVANTTKDISQILDTGELRFKMKLSSESDAANAKDIKMWLKTYEDANPAWGTSKQPLIPDAETILSDDEWHEVVIPLSEFVSGGAFDYSKIKAICFSTPNSTSRFVYIRDMAFYDKKQSPELMFESCGMDQSGYFIVRAKFTSEIDTATVSEDKFSIGGVTAIGANAEASELELRFNLCPEFPSEVTVEIEPGIRSIYDLELEADSLSFETSAVQDKISVSLVTKEPTLTGNTVSAEVRIRAIFGSEDDDSQTAAVLLVVYDGDRIAAMNSADTGGALKRRKTKTISVSAELPEGTTLENPRAELFFFENTESKKPIAEMMSFDSLK